MRIEIWADMICAWAGIGRRRLESALAAWDGEPVEVVWRPYLIDPSAPAVATPMEELLRDPAADEALRACAPGLTPAGNRVRVSEVAAGEGIAPWTGSAWRTRSHDAHRLIVLAHEHGGAALQDAVAQQVLAAVFSRGEDIGSPDVLAHAARAAGFDQGPGLLAHGDGADEVRELLLVGKARGVATSPTFVVNGLALAGAQSSATILAFLTEAAGHVQRRLPAEVERLRHAESLLDRRDPLGALTLLKPLLAEHGEDRGLRLLAARAYYASAQLGRAAAALTELAAQTPDDSYVRHLLGRTLQRQGKAEQAAPHLAMAAAMTPEYAG
ncbi:tetratricopeptide repeat protein [Nonomuraea sp. NN258]|uniref:DsbA family oxidoreductase n=1 Tax=Nonomuraea antri TaxID=2730852 RepID=UPI0015694951|nr:DsbA family protein [Nonomuraea antri]NRQ34964.1 tetratricopeptide repeat protein [Nonomuraea antri]